MENKYVWKFVYWFYILFWDAYNSISDCQWPLRVIQVFHEMYKQKGHKNWSLNETNSQSYTESSLTSHACNCLLIQYMLSVQLVEDWGAKSRIQILNSISLLHHSLTEDRSPIRNGRALFISLRSSNRIVNFLHWVTRNLPSLTQALHAS